MTFPIENLKRQALPFMMTSTHQQDFSSNESDRDYETSVQTVLSDDSVWTSQQTTLDPKLVEYLKDDDLDVFSLSEFLLTSAQAKIVSYSADSLSQQTSIFSHGTGLDFDVDVCKTPTGQLAAVKHVKLLTPMYRKDGSPVSELSQRVRKVLQEIRILKHPPIDSCASIINLIGTSLDFVQGAYTTPSSLLEYAEFGTLRQYLSIEPPRSMDESYQLLVQVAEAVLTIHACRVCHGDIKLDNVLVVRDQDSRTVAKLADFGSSTILKSGDARATYWGTLAYNAPEIQSKDDGGSGSTVQVDVLFACDVFAFGLLLFEALQNGSPYWKYMGEATPKAESTRIVAELVRSYSMALGDKVEKQNHPGKSSTDKLLVSTQKKTEYVKNAIVLCLNVEPKERGDIKSVFLALTGGDHNARNVGNCRQIDLRMERLMNMVNLADPVTFQVMLTGGGHHMSNFINSKPVFGLQALLFSAYQRHCSSARSEISAFMHLQAAICYFIGFGVGRDENKTNAHLALAAASEYPSLRPLLIRMEEIFGVSYSKTLLPPLENALASRATSVLLEAIKKDTYCSPLFEISHAWQIETPEDEPDVGSELHRAAYFGKIERAAQLIKEGHRDYQNDSQFSALMLACIAGSLPVVRMLLETESDMSIMDNDGYTVWHMLALFPLDDILPTAELFQKYSRNASTIDVYSSSPYSLPEMFDILIGTPLHWAIQANNILAVRGLLQAGARVDVYYAGLLSPIALAASLRLYQILELLLSQASLQARDLSKEEPLFTISECHPLRLVFIHGKHLEDATKKTVGLLAEHWNIDALDSQQHTPLLKVALTGPSEVDIMLVKSMLPLAKRHVDGQQYPLVIAAIIGCINSEPQNAKLPLFLIAEGFSIAHTDDDGGGEGWNAVHWAAAYGNIAVLQELLRQDPLLANTPTNSTTRDLPLHIAAMQNQTKKLQASFDVLIGAGADLTALVRKDKLTILGSFVVDQSVDIDTDALEFILAKMKTSGYIARNNDSGPWTVLQMMADYSAIYTILGNTKPLNVLRRLLKFEDIRGLLEVRSNNGYTPILQACLHVDYPTIRELIDNGADFTVSSSSGETCLSILLDSALYPLASRPQSFSIKDFKTRWRDNAYRAAVYLCGKLAKTEGYQGLVLPKLHIAAYMCHEHAVRQLVESGEGNVQTTVGQRHSTTARSLLEGMLKMPSRKSHPLRPDLLLEAERIIEYLKDKEQSNQKI